jgi:hypothetical protein
MSHLVALNAVRLWMWIASLFQMFYRCLGGRVLSIVYITLDIIAGIEELRRDTC